MRILYGVCGEGMGHAMRSAVVARHLMLKGHAVTFAVSGGRAADYLRKKFPYQVVETVGLGLQMERNGVQPLLTILANTVKQIAAFPTAHLLAAIQIPRPNAVISDFDPWSARYAKLLGLPLYAVDNVHFMNRCFHPGDVLGSPEDRQAASIMYPTVGRMVPGARKYFITSFVRAETDPGLRGASEVFQPILREEVARLRPTLGAHVVVYFNDKADWNGILGTLSRVPGEFHVYGSPGKYHGGAGISIRPMSDAFLEDLASSRAVIGGAGFTLMTEAIYLGKPMFAVPFRGQFEQILNANYLQLMGLGERGSELDANRVAQFLARANGYAKNLSGLKHDSNRGLLEALDWELAA